MTQGVPRLPLVEVDEGFREREAYRQGQLTDAPDLSIYDEHAGGETMNEELAGKLKYLAPGRLACPLGRVPRRWPRKQRFSHVRLLDHVAGGGMPAQAARTPASSGCKRARIPEHCVMETFPFDRQPKLNKKMICPSTTPSTT